MSKTTRRLDLLQGRFVDEVNPEKNKSPEANVKKSIEVYLKRIGGYVRQINSGGTIRNGKWTTGGQGSGISDLLCWLPFGRFIAVEVKAPGKKRTGSDEQHKFLTEVISRGMIGCIADDVADVKLALGQTREELLITLNSIKPVKRVRDPATLDPLFPD